MKIFGFTFTSLVLAFLVISCGGGFKIGVSTEDKTPRVDSSDGTTTPDDLDTPSAPTPDDLDTPSTPTPAPKACMDIKDEKTCQPANAYKKFKLECRYVDNTCFDVFITEPNQCKFIVTKTRCEDAIGLYDVPCKWMGNKCVSGK